jgi:hypothetical protein
MFFETAGASARDAVMKLHFFVSPIFSPHVVKPIVIARGFAAAILKKKTQKNYKPGSTLVHKPLDCALLACPRL